jgi:ceramide glucosyltransferase
VDSSFLPPRAAAGAKRAAWCREIAVSLTLAMVLVLAPGWAYLLAAAAAAISFARRPLPNATQCLPVSVLKPLHNAEPGLYDNLRSFAEQDYPATQVVLGVGGPADSALPVARALIHDLPERDIALAVGAGVGANRKVANLENMLPAARGRILVLADSDMRVERHYLAVVTAPLADPRIGIVTCLYRGVPAGGKWSALGALHINFGFLPSALVGAALGLGDGCFGATIALERNTLAAIGGFTSLRDQLADDHRLGAAVRAKGLALHLSRYLVEACVFEPSFAGLWRHELRWARTVRGLAPLGFAGSVLAQPLALAALGTAAARFSSMSCALFAITLLLRWASARAIAAALGLSAAGLWLLPVRDALSFAIFVASLFSRKVVWRDQRYRVEPSGRISIDGDRAG